MSINMKYIKNLVLQVILICLACLGTVSMGLSQEFPEFCDFLNPGLPFYETFCAKEEKSVFEKAAGLSTIGPTGRTTTLITQNLLIPSVKPKSKAKQKVGTKIGKMPNNIKPSLRYEDVDFDTPGLDETADIYGGTLGYAVDRGHTTYGVMIPYDRMEFDDSIIDSVDQFGAILYGKHRKPIAKNKYTLNFIGNINYMYDNIDLDCENCGSDEEINTAGIGGGISITRNGDIFAPTLGFSYQYNRDDDETGDFHTIKTGINTAIYVTPQMPINLYGIYTRDLTNYHYESSEDFWDAGIELAYQLKSGMEISLGYKKILQHEDMDSDQVYLGSAWKF